MKTTEMIERLLADVDVQLSELYKKKDGLNKELRIIQEQKLQQEIERWHLACGKCYLLFDKATDSVCSTLCGYQFINIHDDQFFTMIKTKYSIESRDPHLEVQKVTYSLSALKADRKENTVYCVDPAHFKEAQIGLLSLDLDSRELLEELEAEVVKPRALYQVE